PSGKGRKRFPLANGSFTKPFYLPERCGRRGVGRQELSMSASASLIPELEEIIQHGSHDKRAKMLKRIANLFVDGAPHFTEDHIGLFDDVLCRLVVEIEAKARAEMSRTLAPIGNAPTLLMKKLAHDEDIAVAGPVLAESPRLKDTDLVELARTKGQAH